MKTLLHSFPLFTIFGIAALVLNASPLTAQDHPDLTPPVEIAGVNQGEMATLQAAQNPVITITEIDNNTSFLVTFNQNIEVNLKEQRGSTGVGWYLIDISNKEVLSTPEDEIRRDGPPDTSMFVGRPTQHVWSFKTLSPGTTTLTFSKSRTQNNTTFNTLKVTFQVQDTDSQGQLVLDENQSGRSWSIAPNNVVVIKLHRPWLHCVSDYNWFSTSDLNSGILTPLPQVFSLGFTEQTEMFQGFKQIIEYHNFLASATNTGQQVLSFKKVFPQIGHNNEQGNFVPDEGPAINFTINLRANVTE